MSKPNLVLSTTIGKGHKFFPKLTADFQHTEEVIMKPKISTTTETHKVPRTVSTPVVMMEDVAVSKPMIVMDDQVVQKPWFTLEKVKVQRNVTVKVSWC